jgi:protease I
MASVLMIIAPVKFRDEELFHTKEELERLGHKIIIASKKLGKCTGMLGGTAEATVSIDKVSEKDYDAVVFVGGSGAQVYFLDKSAQKIAKDLFNAGKIVAAICIAPTILANAGVLKGRRATCYPGEQDNLEDNDCRYTGKSVEFDDKIVTANGPASARLFGKKLAEMLS